MFGTKEESNLLQKLNQTLTQELFHTMQHNLQKV